MPVVWALLGFVIATILAVFLVPKKTENRGCAPEKNYGGRPRPRAHAGSRRR